MKLQLTYSLKSYKNHSLRYLLSLLFSLLSTSFWKKINEQFCLENSLNLTHTSIIALNFMHVKTKWLICFSSKRWH